MKRIISLVLVIALWMSMSVAIFALETSKDTKIEFTQQVAGTYFGDSLKAVKTESDLNATLNISSLIFNGNNISLIATATHPEGKISINTTGTLYKSVISDENYVGLFEKNASYTILSFVIETVPSMRGLLTTTQNRITKACRASEDSPVIKIAVMINSTEEVIYFEDTIDSANISKIVTASKKSLAAINEDIKDKLYKNERWFMFFNEENYEVIESPLESVENMNLIFDLLEENNQVLSLNQENTRLEYPNIGIDPELFMTEGIHYMSYHDITGWYMNTREWPVASGNYYSNLIVWEHISDDPITKGDLEGFEFEVVDCGEYVYNYYEELIYKATSYSNYHIRDAKIALTLVTANGDIFTAVKYDYQYTDIDLDWGYVAFSVIKKIPKINPAIIAAITVFQYLQDLVERSTVSKTADMHMLGSYLLESDIVDGKINGRGFLGATLPDGVKLKDPGDRIQIFSKWQEPINAADYYEYYEGPKTLNIMYFYSVYNSGNPIISNAVKEQNRIYY